MVGKFAAEKIKSQVVGKWIWCGCWFHIQQRGQLLVSLVSFSDIRSISAVPKLMALVKEKV
jgi:hypothetical protein